MRQRRLVASALCVWSLGLVTAREARAQATQPLQLGAGYQFLHESVDRGGQSFPVGAYVDLEKAITADVDKAVGWMGQFESGFRSGDGVSEQLYTFLGGVRVASTRPLRWTPSGFGLIGLATQNASCADYCGGTASALAFQAGFALTTRLKQSTLLDIAFKATKLKVEGGTFNAAVAGGIRFDLSKP
jgi:hypothetical protein